LNQLQHSTSLTIKHVTCVHIDGTLILPKWKNNAIENPKFIFQLLKNIKY